MIDSRLLDTTRAAFAGLDFTAENERITALEAERARIEAAEETAQKRVNELSATIAAYMRENPAGAIADALLDDTPASEAAKASPDRDALIEERARLTGGIAELRRRDGDVYGEIRRVQLAASGRAGAAAQGLIEALHADAVAAAQRLAECFAGLDAVLSATRQGAEPRDQVGQAVARLAGAQGLLTSQSVKVPSEIIATLRALEGKGAAHSIGVRELAVVPSDNLAVARVAAAFGTRQAA